MSDANTGAIGKGFNAAGAYEHSFGPMRDHTVYSNPWKDIDARENLNAKAKAGARSIQSKALGPTTGGTGTAGVALVPVYVDPRLVDLSRKYTPMVELIPRVTNQGLTADYNRITSKGGAVTANADAPLADADDDYERASESIKYLYSVGRVLGPMQAAMPSYIAEGFQATGAGINQNPFTSAGVPSAKQLEVLMKARAMKELEENLIWNGDDDSDATQFNGIIDQQSATNVNDLDGAALTWDDIEDTVGLAYDDSGRPNLAVGPRVVVTMVRKLMIDQFRYSPDQLKVGGELPFGVPQAIIIHTLVGPIPLIPSQYLSATASNRQLWFLDMDWIEMRVLQDMTYEDLAKLNDSSKFMLKIYECLIVRAPQFNAFIDNIL